MATNQHIAPGFSFARVGQLLRLSWAVNRKTLFIGIGLQILILWVLPRIGWLTGIDSRQVWVEKFSSNTYIFMTLIASTILAELGWFVLLNRQTQHHVPGAYTLLPASVGEKYLSLLLQGGILLLVFFCSAVGLIALTAIEIPGLWHKFITFGLEHVFYQKYHFYNWDTYEVIATRPFFPFIAPLAMTLCYALASIHFRKVLVALFVTSIVLYVVLPMIALNSEFFEFRSSLIHNTPLYFSIMQYTIMGVCILLFVAIYYRLKTLQIK